MSDTTTTDAAGADNAGASGGGEQQEQKATFTQADIDKAVRERLAREKSKYADYDDLKAKAEGAKTLEQQVAELKQQQSAAEARALRSDIAAKHGISAEDRDLFLTGTDEETLTAQATRLAGREVDRKKQGNVAPKEGGTTSSGSADSEMRDFARNFFGGPS